MSTLTGNQIKDTYQGLLKLADSSTGITQNLQAIQDGLGNDTGLRMSQNQIEAPNIPSYVSLKARYYGPGFNNSNNAQFGAGTQNIILTMPFQDNGKYEYSAITFLTHTITSTNDTFEAALYSTQMINPFGLYPHEQILSGITADTTTTGQKTYVFPTPVSFSGYGAGIYWLVFKISNAGVQPTWRGGSGGGTLAALNQSTQIYGVSEGILANTYSASNVRFNNSGSSLQVFTGLTTFDAVYSNTINTLQSTSGSVAGLSPGFILHTTNS